MSEVKGFVKAEGKKLVNGEGNEILLRGVGLGGWLLPEGYMWCLPKQGDRPRKMEKMIEDLIGEEKARQFWGKYFDRYTSEADIKQIAAEGFNSIRVPINSRHLLAKNQPICFNEVHLQLIDQVINWCKKYSLYVVLDLHGAPGGQTGTNIDDSADDKPELFTNDYNKYLTIEIWRMLAERYTDEWIVAGYDLLNEPLPEWFSEYNNQVMPLYKDIVKAIRKVDQNHMIIIEGVHWATDWSIFEEKFDDNLMLQFHKYWNNPDTESIKAFLDIREELNVPIFMGEGGENNKEWLIGAFRLYEDHDISWNFWTWKKMNRNNSPCSVKIPEDWNMLVDYLEDGIKPDKATAEYILDKFLNNISFDMCEYNPKVVNALFRRAPIRIPAVFYGYKGEGVSFGSGSKKGGQIEFRINDCIEMGFIEGVRADPNFKHMGGEAWEQNEWMYIQLEEGDWVVYEFRIGDNNKSSLFNIDLCMRAVSETGRVVVTIDNRIYSIAEVDCESWETIQLDEEFILEPGLHCIMVKGDGSPVRIKWIDVLLNGEK